MSAGQGRASRAIVRQMVWSISAATLLACSTGGSKPTTSEDTSKASQGSIPTNTMPSIKPGPVSIKESFIARRETTARLRSVTVLNNPVGPPSLVSAEEK